MAITGTDFEALIKPFFSKLFKDMGFVVLEVRNQDSGTQNGFDIKIVFDDNNSKERYLFIECKYYKSAKLDWSEIFTKQIELQSSNYNPTAFIMLSPLQNLSNINDNAQIEFEKIVKFPVEFWTPDKELEELFALDKNIYEKVYDKPCEIEVDKENQLKVTRTRIELILKKKDVFQFSNCIRIKEANRKPNEDSSMVTTLDTKLNSVLDEDDEDRIYYHQLRVNYKVFLEDMQDVNNDLRLKILNWQDNMRARAKRLTNKFNLNPSYNSQMFYHDFFEDAEKQLLTFYEKNDLKDDEEKLLNGIVFELAAECPLDWRKK
ncbi:restriction endonuclease [Maribellus sp. CM-23]|uniref:restriction endonuclease n=1 Tax=Maribellus sp. CM-23 TaxID=2781026 RepID=UPI001F3557F7|nr:restriction endonuclease [Maribellus sp. CM-23]MCE4562850.1 restriction endonuclease [Maribellus sp. CM-23]